MTTLDPLSLDTRRRIYQHLRRNPGKYLRELQREMQMAMGQLEYHLGELEKAGLLTSVLDAHKRYFPTQVQRADRPVLAMLRQEIPRRILMIVMGEGIASKQQLLDALNIPRSTLNHHLKHLSQAGLLAVGKEGRSTIHQVTDEGNVLRLLTSYRSSWLDRMVDAFLDGTGALR